MATAVLSRAQTCGATSLVSRAHSARDSSPQRLRDLLIGGDAQIRRLLELHGQALAHCVVEHRVACGVCGIGDDDRAFGDGGQSAVRENRGRLQRRRARARLRQRGLPVRASCSAKRALPTRTPWRAYRADDDGEAARSTREIRIATQTFRSARISEACW